MKLSGLFNYALVKRLEKTLVRALHRAGTARQIPTMIEVPQGAVELPAINLFTPGVVEHLLPVPSCGFHSLVTVYERFVDAPFDQVKRPGPALNALLREEGSSAGSSFSQQSAVVGWFTAGMRLVALAKRFEGVEVTFDPQTLTAVAEHPQARLVVSPQGMYSNTLGRFVQASVPASYTVWAPLPMPADATAGQVYTTLHRLLEGQPEQPLVRLLYECEKQRVTRTIAVYTFFKREGERALTRRRTRADIAPAAPRQRPRVIRLKSTPYERRHAAESALALLRHPPAQGLLPRLHDVLVPALFTAGEFNRAFGSAQAAQRAVKPVTLAKWVERIEERLRLTP